MRLNAARAPAPPPPCVSCNRAKPPLDMPAATWTAIMPDLTGLSAAAAAAECNRRPVFFSRACAIESQPATRTSPQNFWDYFFSSVCGWPSSSIIQHLYCINKYVQYVPLICCVLLLSVAVAVGGGGGRCRVPYLRDQVGSAFGGMDTFEKQTLALDKKGPGKVRLR